ncbi:hypothetical protein LEP1GSC036_0411 [Leptospira weilii str. 2006001853]|uniref:Uncharacterized protein n=4 Tax=Leptospira weilii TaxID=28184 RepID=A0A828Z3V3_9LEPT|nr:hypothetical protein LEP1GSC036_0411 [Leptospira weilii str. 2006001853]EMJ59963.1 hypothetical protein LEP1GSC051_1882 [Leptospira sp. P2653]EMM73509.1 hypothetical protein LEP1GSC038_2609 [Leptospira weilii str. 2006001855]EMN44852.1 hypothetical protein LEP1GSC086_0734 [Leptospira weilii str. LNT 1234]EMN88096.1 hypothetical protein LEP1GSC108_0754 [Leptospira weilii str. UI 13098]EMY16372.1 hypothetical protein LEP1GSC043_4436 [Leptospira weilii str. Ecochallenge]OMI18530.1 hypothetica
MREDKNDFYSVVLKSKIRIEDRSLNKNRRDSDLSLHRNEIKRFNLARFQSGEKLFPWIGMKFKPGSPKISF